MARAYRLSERTSPFAVASQLSASPRSPQPLRALTSLAAAHTAQVSGVSAAAAAALAPKASKATKGLSNFYTFQAREKRRSELLTLREKFAEDKRKMARMKMQRKGLGAGGAPL